ncbi:MAG TPA: hypothetical protein VFN55_04585 [Solirubrobacteraceae bacterium]|nr:hypothetical protein [Solirubrobacteraceae bacterium]
MGKGNVPVQGSAAPVPRVAVAVLVEGGRRGGAAAAHVTVEAGDGPLDVTLLAVLPHADNSACTMSAEPLNAAVREAAEGQLAESAAALNARGIATRQVMLRARADPPLSDWAARAGIALILLPGRRRPLRRARSHPAAARLRRAGLNVRVV